MEPAPTRRIIKRFPVGDPLDGDAGCRHEDVPALEGKGERVDPVPHPMTWFFGGRAGDAMADGWRTNAEADRMAKGHGWASWEETYGLAVSP